MLTPSGTGRARSRRRRRRQAFGDGFRSLTVKAQTVHERAMFRDAEHAGTGLPDWGCAVTVPTSTNPNPKRGHMLTARAFLSQPAASPTGFGNVNPATSTRKRAWVKRSARRTAASARPGTAWRAFQWCAHGRSPHPARTTRGGQGVGRTSVSFCPGGNVRNTYETLRRNPVSEVRRSQSDFLLTYRTRWSILWSTRMVNNVQEMQDAARRVRR